MSVLEHLYTPGSSLKLLPLIQIITVCLIMICCLGLHYDVLGDSSYHLYVMIGLGLGLLASVSYVVTVVGRDSGDGGDGSSDQFMRIVGKDSGDGGDGSDGSSDHFRQSSQASNTGIKSD